MGVEIQKYLDSAVTILDRFGLKKQPEESQLASLLQEVVTVDQARVTAIARVVQYQGTFNSLVRDNIESMNVSSGYEKITSMFDSVRDDSKRLVSQLDDGKIDAKERLSNLWMKLARGTTHKRFEKIKQVYTDVASRTKVQLGKEDDIIEGYLDFRFAMKEAEVMAHEVLAVQITRLEEAKSAFAAAGAAVTNYPTKNDAAHSRLQLARDELQRAFENEDKKYQLIKDVAENLTIGYNVGETLVGKLKQTHDLKDRVYRQAVTFFTTNEHVFTTLDAVYTSQHGMHEQTQALESMKNGVNKGLEDIATLGNELEKAAMKAGYGSTVNATSVKKLVDAIVSFQEQSYQMADELRTEATANAKEISRIVDEGKQRVASSLEKYIVAKN